MTLLRSHAPHSRHTLTARTRSTTRGCTTRGTHKRTPPRHRACTHQPRRREHGSAHNTKQRSAHPYATSPRTLVCPPWQASPWPGKGGGASHALASNFGARRTRPRRDPQRFRRGPHRAIRQRAPSPRSAFVVTAPLHTPARPPIRNTVRNQPLSRARPGWRRRHGSPKRLALTRRRRSHRPRVRTATRECVTPPA